MSDLRKRFGLDGGEFLDTGMTLQEWFATLDLERIRNSYVQQDREEKRRRMQFTIRLAVEGARIRAIDNFGSAVVEWAIEHVMEGDWDGVAQDIEWCRFRRMFAGDTCPPEFVAEAQARERHHADLWAPFRELLEDALVTRDVPKDSN